jgi:hypothetical protein
VSRTHTAGEQPAEDGDDKRLIEELIFRQYLDEVHLLIDFVSGRADRSLATLTMPNPTAPSETMNSGAIVQAISEMRYPPGADSAVNARNAAILLMAKDRLSALADPARGLTIAYTAMFIAAEAGGTIATWLRRKWPRVFGRNPPHDTRVDLAQRTFPGLAPHAHKFRVWRDLLAWFAILWLFVTGVAYWDAGLGRAALERLDQDWKATVSELTNNPKLIHCNDASKTADAGAQSDDEVQQQFACRKYNYMTLLAKSAGEQVNDVFHCRGMGWSRVVHVWCWNWLLSGSAKGAAEDLEATAAARESGKPVATGTGQPSSAQTVEGMAPPRPEQVSPYAKANAAYWQTATTILTVYTSYVLPMMFALLGTLIGAFRAILNRIGANELAPRDLVRMKTGIATGLVAGIAVGLFLSPSSVPTQGAGGVAGQLTLTASGLGFIAGYASQSFFGYLDKVITTVFPFGTQPQASSTPAVVAIAAAGGGTPTPARPAPAAAPPAGQGQAAAPPPNTGTPPPPVAGL